MNCSRKVPVSPHLLQGGPRGLISTSCLTLKNLKLREKSFTICMNTVPVAHQFGLHGRGVHYSYTGFHGATLTHGSGARPPGQLFPRSYEGSNCNRIIMHQVLILLSFAVMSPARHLLQIFKLLPTDKVYLPRRKIKFNAWSCKICDLFSLCRNYDCADYDNNQHSPARDFA